MRGIDGAHGDFRGSTSLGEAAARVPPVALRALGGCCALPRGVLAPEGASGGTHAPAFGAW